jgi:DeoR/GlpR family transcriptional regulator of sugar metabolism
VTRNVLASEIYSMVAGTDIIFIIGSTLKLITKQLGFPKIPIIVCTNSYSLYEYLVKLGTTKEKCLMIDIIALR